MILKAAGLVTCLLAVPSLGTAQEISCRKLLTAETIRSVCGVEMKIHSRIRTADRKPTYCSRTFRERNNSSKVLGFTLTFHTDQKEAESRFQRRFTSTERRSIERPKMAAGRLPIGTVKNLRRFLSPGDEAYAYILSGGGVNISNNLEVRLRGYSLEIGSIDISGTAPPCEVAQLRKIAEAMLRKIVQQ